MTPRSFSWAVTISVTLSVTRICFRLFFPVCTASRLLALKLTCHFFAHGLSSVRCFWRHCSRSDTQLPASYADWDLSGRCLLQVLNSCRWNQINATDLILFLKGYFFIYLWWVTELPVYVFIPKNVLIIVWHYWVDVALVYLTIILCFRKLGGKEEAPQLVQWLIFHKSYI